MLPVLRILGIANAALWFGATMLFLICFRTGFQSPDMIQLLPGPFAEAALHVIMKSYLSVLLFCSVVSVIQLWAEQWYTGRPIFRLRLSILLSLVVFSCLLKWGIFPVMQKQHVRAHQPNANTENQRNGGKAYRSWKTGFHFVHLIIVGGSLSHLLYISQGERGYRVLGVQQFRG
ncbi:MAG: hypothetical protein HOH33_04120 [Verrucomicrobia bacterium]|nr:hypothetical protein [Verrucomicrobiota bacterium]